MDYFNVYAIMKTMCPPGYQDSGFVATHALNGDTSRAKVHELPQSYSRDNPEEGTLFSS